LTRTNVNRPTSVQSEKSVWTLRMTLNGGWFSWKTGANPEGEHHKKRKRGGETINLNVLPSLSRGEVKEKERKGEEGNYWASRKRRLSRGVF